MLRASVLLGLVSCSACGGSSGTFTNGGADNSAVPGRSYRHLFDEGPGTELPADLISVLGDWSVTPDPAAPSAPRVIRQSGVFPSGAFPRVVVRDLSFEGHKVSVRCRPEAGSTDQACGLMFRFVDSDNYYIIRANALEGNVRLYRVVDGSREQLASAEASVSGGTWHHLVVEAQGSTLRARWDDAELFEISDDTFKRGKVGLWTKADSVTAFDDLEVVAD